MNSTKEQMIKIIKAQPDESTFDDILKKLCFIGSIYKNLILADRKINNKDDCNPM
jgi:hypothetical protein